VALPDAEKAEVLSRLERIRELMNQLETITADARRREVRDKVRQELDATKQAIRLLGTHDPDIEPA